jgi:hypothetical protein
MEINIHESQYWHERNCRTSIHAALPTAKISIWTPYVGRKPQQWNEEYSELRGLSPRASYTDRVTAACRRR